MSARRKGKAAVGTTVSPSVKGLERQHQQQQQQQQQKPRAPTTPSSSHEYAARRHTPHEPPEHVRHYPLDLPSGLPFERYEHRCISTRDILVHRILSNLLFPSTRELASAFDEHRKTVHEESRQTRSTTNHGTSYDSDGVYENPRLRHHNFGPVKRHDSALARDIEVLRKTLTTSIASEWVQNTFFQSAWPIDRTAWSKPTGTPKHVSVEDEVLDLVRVYFMETDDAVMRVWLQSLQLPHRASYDTLSELPAKKHSHRVATQGRRRWHDRHAEDEHKKWYKDDRTHLQRVRRRRAEVVTSMPRLYDGGVFMPRLRQPLLKTKAMRLWYLSRIAAAKDTPFDATTYLGKQKLFPWPEPREVPKRYLHMPSYEYRSVDVPHHWYDPPVVNLSKARAGRGLDRDEVWSTTSRWADEEHDRGRTRRRQRRRAMSEPPPGFFMASQLPTNYSLPRELIIFPKMSLARIERRVRPRSLSRTRIAEMFNWDVVIEQLHENEVNEHTRWAEPWSNRSNNANLQWARVNNVHILVDKLVQQIGIPDMGFKETIIAWITAPGQRDGHGEFLDLYSEMREQGDFATSTVEQRYRWVYAVYEARSRLQANAKTLPTLCENCKSTCHATRHCEQPCGYCGAANPWKTKYRTIDPDDLDGNPHIAPNCPVGKQNRCKCLPFPQYHVAAKCRILCSRDCGNHLSPGHFKHKSAMSCQSRCCMCGIRGHSGVKCKLRRCRCGRSHLGQDCSFHPECRVQGCDRFLCGVHCQSCGLNRAELDDGVVLVDQRCPTCRGGDGPINVSTGCEARSPQDEIQEEATRGHREETGSVNPQTTQKKRSNHRKHRSVGPKPVKEEQPWYAPLEPRTRPIVLSKSGQKNDARYHKNGSS